MLGLSFPVGGQTSGTARTAVKHSSRGRDSSVTILSREGEREAERREEGRAPEVSAGASAPGQAAVEPPILQAWGEVKKTQTL